MAIKAKSVLITILVLIALTINSPLVFSNDNDKVNINTATEEEFTTLNGIGEAIAKRIVEYRDQYGSFKSVDELQNIKGIGGKRFEKLKDFFTIGEESEEKTVHEEEHHE